MARAFKGDANAEASSFRNAGIVEINHGLTMAAMIYSTLFCHFYESVLSAATEVDFSDEDEEITQMIVDELERSAFEPILIADQSVGKWATEGNVYAAHPLLIELPVRRTENDYHTLVTAAETFVVAHEFCHHMLGHTDEYFRHAGGAKKVVYQWLSQIDADGIMEKLNSSQKQEVEADVAAFLLTCGLLSEGGSRPRVYRAVGGSMIALVALAHVNQSWVSEGVSSTHPGVLERYEILAKIIKEITMRLPIGEEGKGHPIGFLIQFRGFISVVLQTISSRMGGDVDPPSLLNIFSWMIDLEAEFKEEHKDYHRGEVEDS
ncbi:hypothetical protein [Streptomyces sp. NPDC096311]|uniref:hypothetical protein n=1 Tax=Streptomyces sp. NPDC096311 TaxID=3366083 RepID=UPI0038121A8A